MAYLVTASKRQDINENVGNYNNKQQQSLEPPPSRTNFLSELLARINGESTSKSNNSNTEQDNKYSQQEFVKGRGEQQQQQPVQRRACRAPLSRRFAHPCPCNQSSSYKQSHANSNSSGPLPPAAYTIPLHLWDPMTKKCLPTSRSRDMLLRECRPNVASPYPLTHQLYQGPPCVYDDLVCDARRNRCVCKPSLHLYYESNWSTFGCVPIVPMNGPDGKPSCRSGYIYNVISKECQKIFDVNELPPTYTTGVSATQFSFVTIVLIWILLLILILTTKLRKFRSNIYRNSPTSERRLHRSSSHRYQNQGTPAWLHPFIAAVNGHHHLNQHRSNLDSQSQIIDNQGNYNDTEFFLANGRRANDMSSTNNNSGSQLSLNNPPPKFEEIYPACRDDRMNSLLPPPPPPPPPASNEDLPSYDEAMKLRNTTPPDINSKE